jgi:hypothetical protein
LAIGVTDRSILAFRSFRETAFYAQGAGLGASKGKDISKLTEGYGYLQMAQEAVRSSSPQHFVRLSNADIVCRCRRENVMVIDL